MIILKHVKYQIKDSKELKRLQHHLRETTLKVDGVELKDIYFPKDKDEFVLVMECINENKYLEWREICPPPNGAEDWYELWLSQVEYFSR